MARLAILSLLLTLALATNAWAAAPRTFAEAKKVAWTLYAGNPEFYCGCRFSGNKVDLKSCGYVPRKNALRAARIEWEHIVPAWVIGHQRRCWQKGGRSNCSRNDEIYRRAEADRVEDLVEGTVLRAQDPSDDDGRDHGGQDLREVVGRAEEAGDPPAELLADEVEQHRGEDEPRERRDDDHGHDHRD